MNKRMRKKMDRLQLVVPPHVSPGEEERYFQEHLKLRGLALDDRVNRWIIRVCLFIIVVSYLIFSTLAVIEGNYWYPLWYLVALVVLIVGLYSLFTQGLSTRDFAAMIWWDQK